jgi:hypothetical protein
VLKWSLNLGLMLFVMVSVGLVVLMGAARWFGVWSGMMRGATEGADGARK